MNTAVIIYEDNELLRRSIELLLQTSTQLIVKGSFPDCNDVEKQVAELKPTLIIMDIDMPGMSGILGVKKIKEIVNKTNKLKDYTDLYSNTNKYTK